MNFATNTTNTIKALTFISIFGFGVAASSIASAAYTCPSGYPIDCNNGLCCPANTLCTATGQCESTNPNPGGYGGSGGGTFVCPTNFPVNCNNGYCCPFGDACLAGGQCGMANNGGSGYNGGYSGGGNGGSQCPAGYPLVCGDGTCAAADAQCCASYGNPGKSCRAGTTCSLKGTGCESLGGNVATLNSGCSATSPSDFSILTVLLIVMAIAIAHRKKSR